MDAANDAYITGYSGASGLASTNAYDTQPDGMDAFIAKLDSQLPSAPAPFHFEVQAPRFLPPDGDPVFRFTLENRSTQAAREPLIQVCASSAKVAFTDANTDYQTNGCCATMKLKSLAAGQATEASLTITPVDLVSSDLNLTSRVQAKGFRPQRVLSSSHIGAEPFGEPPGEPRFRAIYLLLLALAVFSLFVWLLKRRGN